MARLMGIELLLMLLTGLFAAVGTPWLLGFPPAWPLFLVGLMMAMSFVAMYALANLAGKRMGGLPKLLVGLLAYLAVFLGPLLLAVERIQLEGGLPLRVGYTYLAAPLFGLLLVGVGALLPSGGRGRMAQVGDLLFAYAVPMAGIRYLLVSLVGVNPYAQLIAMQAGALYLLLRGLVRLFAPTSAEGNVAAGPLVYRPVPDRVVGLVEAIGRRSARPYATAQDGSLDEGAISLLCKPEEAAELRLRIQQAIGEQPFTVLVGEEVAAGVELVVRPVAKQRAEA